MFEHAAMAYYHGAEGFNCAQAVAKGLEKTAGEHGELIASLSKCGGGRAEGGVCGTLCAAKALVPDAQAYQDLVNNFSAQAGSTICKEIRKLKRLTCKECVGLSAQLIQTGKPLQ